MRFSTRLNKLFADKFWNVLPSFFQKLISDFLAFLYSTQVSKFFIGSFARRYNLDQKELSKYVPGSGRKEYSSFQDFFTRQLVTPLTTKYNSIFPCEGQVCESGLVADLNEVNVKGQKQSVKNIFGNLGQKIPDTYFFINLFLHNHNYHRFHAPVSGVIKSMQYIPGQLNFLRPWLYPRKQVSEPALVNERVVLEIEDTSKQLWFLTFVGGMCVGKIKLHEQIRTGYALNCGEEIGLFLLGSTCCIAAPVQREKIEFLSKVKVGDPI